MPFPGYSSAQDATFSITAGPDGALWYDGLATSNTSDTSTYYTARVTTGGSFTNFFASKTFTGSIISSGIGNTLTEITTVQEGVDGLETLTTSGDFSYLTLPVENNGSQVIVGPDGNLWFPSPYNVSIDTIVGGNLTTYPIPGGTKAALDPGYICVGPDGALWATNFDNNEIVRITTSGVATVYPVPTPKSYLGQITAGPDGALWFVEDGPHQIGRITTSGEITEYPLQSTMYGPGATTEGPGSIVAAPDGALWFPEDPPYLGRITTSGVISNYSYSTANYNGAGMETGAAVRELPGAFILGPDNAFWFTGGSNAIGHIAVPSVSATNNRKARR